MKNGLILKVWLCLWAGTLSAASAQELPSPEEAGWLDAPRFMRAQTRFAIESEDWEAAWRLNAAGRALQPGHTGLIRQAIGIADAAGDEERLISALGELARAGSFLDTDELKTGNAIAPRTLATIRQRFAANQKPVGSADVAVEVNLPDALIESVAVDRDQRLIYLGSVMDRAIYRVDQEHPGKVQIFADRGDGLFSVFGMVIDEVGDRLYVATGVVPQTPLAEGEKPGTGILVLDPATGSVKAHHRVDGAKQIADLTLIDKTLYVTDSQAPRIYRLEAEGRELELFAEDSRFVSLQGIAGIGEDLIVADYGVGLWRVDRHTGKASMVQPPEAGQSLIGLDGLTAGPDRTIYAVRNGTSPQVVLRLTFSEGGKLMKVETVLRGHERFDEPTLMTIEGGMAYLVARSQWPLFPADGSPPSRPRANPVILTWPVEQER